MLIQNIQAAQQVNQSQLQQQQLQMQQGPRKIILIPSQLQGPLQDSIQRGHPTTHLI